MAIDLFGQGKRRLPSPTENYSHGPDRKRGPGKCRGVIGDCSGTAPQPHDHSCCCDPCRHKYNSMCGTKHCCRCVPKYICATFTSLASISESASASISVSDDYSLPSCRDRQWRLEAQTTLELTTYTLTTNAEQSVILSVGRNDGADSACTWRIEITGMNGGSGSESDDIYTLTSNIDHSGTIHCQAPPDWVIEDFNLYVVDSLGARVDCYGTLRFSEYELAKIPFVNRWIGQGEFSAVTCAECTEVCSVLCVRRGNAETEVYTRTDFVWDDQSQQWNGTDGEYITLSEVNGACNLHLESISPSSMIGVKIPMVHCTTEMSVMHTDETGQYIKISCNPCSCWDYLCGTCRCVCSELCIVGVQDNNLVAPFSMAWDYQNLRWGSAEYGISLSKDVDGNCQGSITGYEDPSAVSNSCGGDIWMTFSSGAAAQLETGLVNFLYATCRQCAESCSAGTCLDDCEDVPKVLYAELSAANWNEMLGCDPLILCFETIVIPLVQVFIPTLLNPAGEYRWIGAGIIACHDCTPLTSNENFLVSIDVGCDGILTVSITNDGVAAPCSTQFGFTLPCGAGELWDFDFGRFDCDGLNGCCDEAGFLLRVTE